VFKDFPKERKIGVSEGLVRAISSSSSGNWTTEKGVQMLWIIVLALVILAIAGGLAVSKLLFLVLIAALVLALFSMMSGRTTA
jgi:hypothetical protein